jgi:hypothetical protein
MRHIPQSHLELDRPLDLLDDSTSEGETGELQP